MATVAMGETEPVSVSLGSFIFGRQKEFPLSSYGNSIYGAGGRTPIKMRALYAPGGVPTTYINWVALDEPDDTAFYSGYDPADLQDIEVIHPCVVGEQGELPRYGATNWTDLYNALLAFPIGTQGDLINANGQVILTARNLDGSNITIADEGPVYFNRVTPGSPEIDLTDINQYDGYHGLDAIWSEGGLYQEAGSNLNGGVLYHKGHLKFLGRVATRLHQIKFAARIEDTEIGVSGIVGVGLLSSGGYSYGLGAYRSNTYWVSCVMRDDIATPNYVGIAQNATYSFVESSYFYSNGLQPFEAEQLVYASAVVPHPDFAGSSLTHAKVPLQTEPGYTFGYSWGPKYSATAGISVAMIKTVGGDLKFVLDSLEVVTMD